MAIVGEAIIVVRTMSAGFDKQLKDSVKGIDRIGEDAGQRLARGVRKGAGRGNLSDIFSKDTNSFKSLGKEASKALESFNNLQRAGYVVGTAIGVLGSSLSSLVVGLVSLGGAVLSAAPALVALGGGLAAIVTGGLAAKLALSGIGAAVGKLNKQKTSGANPKRDLSKELAKIAQKNAENLAAADKKLEKSKLNLIKAQLAYNKALKEGAEEIQQLGFDAEGAAIAEKKAAIQLEQARETLARVQDLPPNSRARREAELAYEEADLNLREAIDKNKDLQLEQDRLAKQGVAGTNAVISATENLTGAEESYKDAVDGKAKAERNALQDVIDAKERAAKAAKSQDPLAGLTASQKVFAKFLSGLKPQFDSLKEAAASGFLPILQTSIQQIVTKAFPTFKEGLHLVGKAMGNASKSVSDAIVNGENLKKLDSLFKSSGGILESLGKSVGSIWGSLLSILQAAEPLTKRFFGWIEKTTAGWDKMLSTKNADGSLGTFFKTAGDIAAQIGKIFGNTFGFIGNIVKANTGPGSGGQILLDYLKDVTAGWKRNTDYTGDGPGSLREFFRDAAENLKSILKFIGGVAKEFIKLAGDPNTKKFWDTLSKATPYIGKIFKNLNEGGPAMADLLVTITKIIAVLTEANGVKAFFKTLNKGATLVLKFFESKPVKAFMKVAAPLHGFFLALGTMFVIGRLAGMIFMGVIIKVVGYVAKFVNVLKAIPMLFRAMMTIIADMAAAVGMAVGPFLLVVAGIAAIIAILIGAYKYSKAFRDSIAHLGKVIKEHIIDNFNKIKKTISEVFGGGKGGGLGSMEQFKKVLKSIGDFIAKYIMPSVEVLAVFIIDVLGGAIRGLIYIFGAVKDAFMFTWNIIKGIFQLLTGDFDGAGESFKNAFGSLISFFENIFKAIWAIIEPFVKILIDALSPIWNVLKTGLEFVWKAIKFIWDLLVAGVKGYIDLVVKVLSTIWNGLKTGIDFVWNGVKAVWDTILSFITGLKEKIAKIGSTMWDGLKSGLEIVINFIIKGVNLIIKTLNKAIDGANVLNPFKDIPNIPEIQPVKLARGGVVSPSSGGTLAMIAEAGRPERVEPLDAQGLSARDRSIIKFLAGKQGASTGTNLTFKVYPSEKMSEADLAAAISRQVGFMIRKGGV